MSQDSVLARNEVNSSMETERPFASYIKTILGKVAVTVWDNTLDKPVDVILEGNPKRAEEGCIVKVWNTREDSVFKRLNVKLFKKGLIIPYTIPEQVQVEKSIEQSTDDELKEIVNSKWMALTNKLNKIDSVPVLFRMKNLAEEMEKSSKVTEAIEKRISEVQLSQYQAPAKPGTESEEE
jgi:hypothetical protein